MFEPGKMAKTVACQLCTKTDRLSTQLRLINFIKVKCIFIAPAYSRVRYRSPNFCPSVCSFVRLSTFTSKFGFLDIRDSCESETLHSYCP